MAKSRKIMTFQEYMQNVSRSTSLKKRSHIKKQENPQVTPTATLTPENDSRIIGRGMGTGPMMAAQIGATVTPDTASVILPTNTSVIRSTATRQPTATYGATSTLEPKITITPSNPDVPVDIEPRLSLFRTPVTNFNTNPNEYFSTAQPLGEAQATIVGRAPKTYVTPTNIPSTPYTSVNMPVQPTADPRIPSLDNSYSADLAQKVNNLLIASGGLEDVNSSVTPYTGEPIYAGDVGSSSTLETGVSVAGPPTIGDLLALPTNPNSLKLYGRNTYNADDIAILRNYAETIKNKADAKVDNYRQATDINREGFVTNVEGMTGKDDSNDRLNYLIYGTGDQPANTDDKTTASNYLSPYVENYNRGYNVYNYIAKPANDVFNELAGAYENLVPVGSTAIPTPEPTKTKKPTRTPTPNVNATQNAAFKEIQPVGTEIASRVNSAKTEDDANTALQSTNNVNLWNTFTTLAQDLLDSNLNPFKVDKDADSLYEGLPYIDTGPYRVYSIQGNPQAVKPENIKASATPINTPSDPALVGTARAQRNNAEGTAVSLFSTAAAANSTTNADEIPVLPAEYETISNSDLMRDEIVIPPDSPFATKFKRYGEPRLDWQNNVVRFYNPQNTPVAMGGFSGNTFMITDEATTPTTTPTPTFTTTPDDLVSKEKKRLQELQTAIPKTQTALAGVAEEALNTIGTIGISPAQVAAMYDAGMTKTDDYGNEFVELPSGNLYVSQPSSSQIQNNEWKVNSSEEDGEPTAMRPALFTRTPTGSPTNTPGPSPTWTQTPNFNPPPNRERVPPYINYISPQPGMNQAQDEQHWYSPITNWVSGLFGGNDEQSWTTPKAYASDRNTATPTQTTTPTATRTFSPTRTQTQTTTPTQTQTQTQTQTASPTSTQRTAPQITPTVNPAQAVAEQDALRRKKAQEQAQAVLNQSQNKAVSRWSAPNGAMQAAQSQQQIQPKSATPAPQPFDPSKMGYTAPSATTQYGTYQPSATTATTATAATAGTSTATIPPKQSGSVYGGGSKLSRDKKKSGKLKKDISVGTGLTAHATQPVKESPMPKMKTSYGRYKYPNSTSVNAKYGDTSASIRKQMNVMYPRQEMANVMPMPPAREHNRVQQMPMSYEPPQYVRKMAGIDGMSDMQFASPSLPKQQVGNTSNQKYTTLASEKYKKRGN